MNSPRLRMSGSGRHYYKKIFPNYKMGDEVTGDDRYAGDHAERGTFTGISLALAAGSFLFLTIRMGFRFWERISPVGMLLWISLIVLGITLEAGSIIRWVRMARTRILVYDDHIEGRGVLHIFLPSRTFLFMYEDVQSVTVLKQRRRKTLNKQVEIGVVIVAGSKRITVYCDIASDVVRMIELVQQEYKKTNAEN